MVNRLRLFVVAEVLPRPDFTAGERRFVALLEMFARHHRVDVWIENDWQNPVQEQITQCRRRLEAAGVRLLRPGRKSFVFALATNHYNIGFFEFYGSAERNAAEFRRRQPSAKVIIDSVDVHFARESAGKEFLPNGAARAAKTRIRELAAYRAADAVIVVTDEDERILHAEGGMPQLFIIPIVMPVHSRSPKPRGQELLFIGGFDHTPNLDGLRWFVDCIWPSVRESVPDASFTIIGSNTPPEVKAFDGRQGIQVFGFIADTTPYFDRAAISVAPLRYGAGMKGKVVEAMSYGLPVVTTSVGAQGIGGTSGRDLMIADSPADFAQAVTNLLNGPARAKQIGLVGQAHIGRLCSPERIEVGLQEMLETITSNRRPIKDWLKWRRTHAMFALRIVARRLAFAHNKIRPQ
jgi:glycosyltransferase involved in cell wall biosynthesis